VLSGDNGSLSPGAHNIQRSAASVAIRVDSGAHIGGGHLYRCRTLAEELRRRGVDVHFVSREHPGHLLDRLDGGFTVHRLPAAPSSGALTASGNAWLGVGQDEDAAATRTALAGIEVDWLVVDHYGIDAEWERRVRGLARHVMVIDDLADRPHDASLLLDQNYFGTDTAVRYEQRVANGCRRLLGPRYALLQAGYRQLRRSLPPRSGTVGRILVFFGMNDPTRAASRVLEALSNPDFSRIALDVVVGSDAALLAEVRSLAGSRAGVTVHEQLSSLADLTASADLAIGGCGATTWERACLGVPALVATIADNQVALAHALAAEGFAVLVGRSERTASSIWRIVIRQLLKDPGRLAALGNRMRGLTDGHGAGRVARVMLGGDSPVVVRRCSAADEPLLLEWANDPETRRFAFNRSRIADDEHHRWFCARLEDPSYAILIGEDSHGLPLGQVRFDLYRDTSEATINISVDVALRGTRIGGVLLREAVAVWRKSHPDIRIIAEVVAGNEASRRLFSSAGFAVTASRRPETITFESLQ
jgi:UDP-2,4-diacetamido-2,4,6-trideoxy-beta-L-altropyranose hydrolase